MILENDPDAYASVTTTVQAYQGASGGKHANTYNHMMHNQKNTDINILMRNCNMRNLANSRYK
jgi:Fe-S cluster assembly scaffold protein SufB